MSLTLDEARALGLLPKNDEPVDAACEEAKRRLHELSLRIPTDPPTWQDALKELAGVVPGVVQPGPNGDTQGQPETPTPEKQGENSD